MQVSNAALRMMESPRDASQSTASYQAHASQRVRRSRTRRSQLRTTFKEIDRSDPLEICHCSKSLSTGVSSPKQQQQQRQHEQQQQRPWTPECTWTLLALALYLLPCSVLALKPSMVDLTHTYVPETMPQDEAGVQLEMMRENRDHGFGARSEFFEFCMDETLGTHINAPSMYIHHNGTLTTDQLPLELLVRVPAVVIDLPHNATNRDALLTRDHLDHFERLHGPIPAGAIVLLRTGWEHYFKQPDKFLGNFENLDKQAFPGFSGESASWLLSERDVSGLGTECIDVELGWKTKNEVKQLLAAQAKISLVQLANLHQLPKTHIELTVAPLKLQGGAGGPARVFAVNTHREHGHHRRQQQQHHRRQQHKKRHNGDEEEQAGGAPYRATHAPPSEQTWKAEGGAASSVVPMQAMVVLLMPLLAKLFVCT